MNLLKTQLGVLALVVGFNAWAEPTVSFSESKIVTGINETITVDIVMSDFPTTEGGGLTIKYNSDVLQIVDVELNDAAWNFASQEGKLKNDKGRLRHLLFSSFSGISGDAVIATVTLEAIAEGRSRLKLVQSKKNPFASGGQPLDVSFNKSVVRVK